MSHKKGSIIWKGNVWEKLLVTHGKIIYIYWENYAIQCKILYLVLNINSSQNIVLNTDTYCKLLILVVPLSSQSKKKMLLEFVFFNCYLAVPQPTLGHSQGDSFTNPMLIAAYVHIQPEPLAGFEPGTFWFLFQCLNPLGHSDELIRLIVFILYAIQYHFVNTGFLDKLFELLSKNLLQFSVPIPPHKSHFSHMFFYAIKEDN